MPATEEQQTRLFKAAEAGELEMFQEAASAIEEDIRQLHAANGANCLHIAAHAGRSELCKHLAEDLHFEMNAQDSGGRGSTPLVLAMSEKHWDTAELLLSLGPDVNRQGSGEGAAAPLHLAVADGQLELARKLLEAGASPNQQSGSGSPLMLAVARSNAPMIELLLRHGADVNEPSRKGLSPLFMAVAVGGSAECVRLLVGMGADVNGRALGAFTPLHVAAESGKAEVAEVLLQAGADPEAKDDYGHTPARVAGMHGHRQLVEVLLRRGGGGGDSDSGATGGPSGGGGDSDSDSGATGGPSGGGGDSDSGATGGPSGGVDVFMQSSWADLQRREEAVASSSTAITAKPAGGTSVIRIPDPEVEDEALADTFKRKGNEFFVAGDYEGAAKLYELALSHWTRNAVVWSNRAACFVRLERYENALQDARIARTLDQKYVKAWYREGRAAEGLKRYEDAATAYYQAAQLQPDNDEFIKLTKEMIVEGRKEYQAEQAAAAMAAQQAAAAGGAAAAAAAEPVGSS